MTGRRVRLRLDLSVEHRKMPERSIVSFVQFPKLLGDGNDDL